MNPKDVINILISMKTHEKEEAVEKLMERLELLEESEFQEKFQEILEQIGNSEEAVKKVLSEKIKSMLRDEQKYPINEMFTYGVSRNSIHLHLPGSLEQMMNEIGRHKTIDTVNLYLLDAIGKVAQMWNDGFYRFKGTDNIYMNSPILIGPELLFLEEFGFKTQIYNKKQLKSEEFLEKNPEARLAKAKHGVDKNVGTAVISINKISTPEWQTKKRETIQEFNQKGIFMQEDDRTGGMPEQ